MTRLAASRVREAFSDILNKVAYTGARIVLHRHGKDIAALVSIEDLARLEALEALEDAHDVATARAAAEDGPAVPWEQLKTELPL